MRLASRCVACFLSGCVFLPCFQLHRPCLASPCLALPRWCGRWGATARGCRCRHRRHRCCLSSLHIWDWRRNFLFASIIVVCLLKPIDGLLRQRAANRLALGDTGDGDQGGISYLLSFVDDISSCVYLPDLHFLCEQVCSHGTSIECFVNPHKTRVLTSCNRTSILPTLSIHNPPLARSLSTSIASFSTTPHPTNKTALDIPVELTTGFRLLGQPVGSATFASDFFACRIDDVKKNITSLLDNITNQQTRL